MTQVVNNTEFSAGKHPLQHRIAHPCVRVCQDPSQVGTKSHVILLALDALRRERSTRCRSHGQCSNVARCAVTTTA